MATPGTQPNLNDVINNIVDKDGVKFHLIFDSLDMIIFGVSTFAAVFVGVLGGVLIANKISGKK